jgi:hypothetical protein
MYRGQIKELSINRMDTYNSSQEAIEIRTILNLKNQSLDQTYNQRYSLLTACFITLQWYNSRITNNRNSEKSKQLQQLHTYSTRRYRQNKLKQIIFKSNGHITKANEVK